MSTKFHLPVFIAGAALAAGLALAPTAAAGSNVADCKAGGSASLCSRPGHTAIVANTPVTRQGFPIAPGGNPFGNGPVPPLLAMD